MNLSVWLEKTQLWFKNLTLGHSVSKRKRNSRWNLRHSLVEVMEQRLLLTGGAGNSNDPGEFYYSLTSTAHLSNSDNSRVWADDSDIVKLTINADGSWEHEIYFDGSDVGLNHWEEDIDAFSIRQDGSILISTLGCVDVPGVRHSDGGDLLKFTPSSLGQNTSGSWEMYVDGSDLGLSHYENIDAVSELADGRLVISTQRDGYLPGVGNIESEDLSVLTLTATGQSTRGEWNRFLDGSDISLRHGSENIDSVTVGADGTSVLLSTVGTASASGLYAADEDIFLFQASALGSNTSGSYANKLTLNGSRAGIHSCYDIDAFHIALGDPANPQPPVIDTIGAQEVNEGTTFELTPTASDPDTPTSELTWSLASGPSSASVDPVSGRLQWTPQESDGPGTFDVTLSVTDGDLTDTETFSIVVNEVNTAPVLAAIANQTVGAGATVAFRAEATDADLPANSLVYSLTGQIPPGAVIDSSTGEFRWETTSANSGSSYHFSVSVSDGQLTDSKSVTVAVSASGFQIDPIGDQSVDELTEFQYQVVATGGSSTLPNMDFEQAGGNALNSGDVIAEQFASLGIHITTHDPARYPAMIFDSSNPTGRDYDLGTPNQKYGGPGIGNGGKSGRWRNDVAENNILIISEDGDSSDPDDRSRGGTLIFTFDTPTDIDDIRMLDVDSGRNTITFYNAAGQKIGSRNIPRRGNNSIQTLNLNVQGVSRMEVKLCGSGAITDLTFDRDGDSGTGGVLTYALSDSAPNGMTISDAGLIEWTPTEAQGPGIFDVSVLVSDGTTTLTETFQVTVNEVNVAPLIDSITDQSIDELDLFELQVQASDSDLPANTLTYSLAPGFPSGMMISGSGLIQWTPSEAQGAGSYPVTVEVSDGMVTSTEDFVIAVGEVNVAPLIDSISDQTIDELVLFELQVQASDTDLPGNSLTYSLAPGFPSGMMIDGSGLIQWTPSEAQGEGTYLVTVEVSDGTATSTEDFQVTVGEVNLAPIITPIADQTIDELTLFALQVDASDADLPANSLTYSLSPEAPAGMMIDGSGLIQWTPSEAQGPRSYSVTVTVSDGSASVQESFELTVVEINASPVLSPVSDQSTNEAELFEIQVNATDPDLPANALSYELISAVPSGMAIDQNGLISWTPTEAQGPASYDITVQVSDGELTDVESFRILVAEQNQPPVLASIGEMTVFPGSRLSFQATATDPDLPANTLTYSITGNVPAEATIDSETGLFTWDAPVSTQLGERVITVIVDDQNGAFDSETVTITVEGPGVATITLTEDDRFETTASQSIVVPTEASYFEFEILDLSFDTDASGQVRDAFEVALLDSEGKSVVHTIGNGRDSFFNITESDNHSVSASVVVMGSTVRVDLSHLAAGTTATVVYRLVNNDNSAENDSSSTVTVTEGVIIEGDLDTPIGTSVSDAVNPELATSLASLTDVTGSLEVRYGQTSFNADSSTLFAEIELSNNATHPIDGPFVVVVENLTDPLVAAVNFDGTTDHGNPYYLVNGENGLDTLSPAAVSESATLNFLNPNQTPFEYRLTILAAPNDAPTFTSTPITLVEAGRPYSYDSNADDPDGDTLTYELLAGPEGMTIDSITGEITWSPETGNEGNHSVVIKASDGRGAFDEQQFTVEVRDLVPNRPPVIISTPVTQVVLPSVRPQVIGVWNQFRAADWNLIDGEFTDSYRADLAATFGSAVVTGTAALNADFLAKVDILVIGATSDHAGGGPTPIKPLTAIEQSALYDFVSGGGSVLLMTENSFQYQAASNSLLAPFGMTSSGFNENEFRASVTAPDHPVFNGPNGAVTGYDLLFPGEFLDLGPNAVSIAEIGPGRSVAAVIEPGTLNEGSGAVVALVGQVTMVDSDHPGLPATYSLDSEEQIIHRNIISYLGGADISSAPSSVYEYDVDAIDADADPLTYELRQGPAGMKIDPETGAIRWIPTLGQTGPTESDVTVTSYTQLDISPFLNMRIQDNGYWATQSYQGGPIGVDGVPFNLPLTGNSSWLSHYDSAGNYNAGESVLELDVGLYGATEVHSLINSYWGETGPGVRAHVEFIGSDGAFYRFDLDGNDDIRDFNQNHYTNNINGVTTVNAISFSGNQDRLDKVKMTLPDEFATQTLERIRFVDNGSSGFQMIFVSGVTVATETPIGDSNHVKILVDDGRGGTATQEFDLAVLADPSNTAPVIVTNPVDNLFIPGFSNPASGDVTPQRISLDLGNGETFDGTVSITLPDQAGRFADIVISVDESSSMGGDQDWIPGMIPQLDDALKAQGIGATSENPNRFAIVGGGRQNLVSYFFSQQPNTKYTLYGPNNEVVAEGMIDEVLPDELLNLQLEDDGRYVLVVEAENAANLNGGIDIGIEGDLGDGARIEPLALNTLVSDAFTLPGQAVEYQFSLDVETLLYFDTQTKDLSSTIGWTLEGPNGPIASQNSIQFSDVADSTPTIAAGPGDYVLRLDAKYDTASDFKFQLLDLSAVTPLTSGQSVSDEFETKVETKAYRFSASQGQIFSLNNTNAVVHSGSKWRLFDQSGSVLLSQSMGTNIAGFELPSTGEFYLLMEAALWPHEGNAQLRQPSVFDFTAEFVDPLPPTAIAPGDTVNGVIDFVGDFEVYSFTVASRSNLYIDSLTDNSMTWTLTGPTGTRSALRFNSTDSFNSANPVLNLVDGDYTMRIDSNGQTGLFAFRVLDLADSTPITPGTEFDGVLTVSNQTNGYRFAALAGDEIFIDVVTASDTNNTEYKLYTQYGEKLFESNRLNDSGTLTIPADGTYTLLVEGWRGNEDQDTYTINVVPVTSTTQPLTLDAVTNGVLATPGESAVYTFSLGADTQLYFDSLTNDSNVLWSLEGPRGEEVSPLRFDRSDSLDRVDASIDALAGDYRLTIQGNGDHVGSYSFSLLDLFNSAHSTVVSPNPGAGNPSVTISPNAGLVALQTEVFRFTAAAGDEFSFVTTVTGSIGSSYRVLDSTGTEVIPRTSLSTDQSNETLTAGGTYFLLVEPRYNNVDVDVWSMDINFVQNNGTTSFSGTPLVLGTTINGDLNTASQVDEFTFAVTQRGNYYFDSLTNNSTIRWSLSGPTGTVISNRALTSTDAHNQTNVGLDLIPGNYQIAIEASSGTPGAYGFRFQNLESAAPITFGTPFGEDLTPANETDLYTFDVVAGETFYFDVEAASDVNNSLYRVIDPFGRTAFTANDLRDFGPTTLDFDGTYTLLVEGWRGNVGVDTYSINVHKVPVNAVIPLSLGDTVTDSLSTPGETAVYTFSVTDYTQVHFDSLTNSAIYNWTLEGAAGTIVDGRGFHQSDSSNVAQAVIELTPGDYRLTIEGTGETQDYSFRLLDISDATPIVFDTATTSPHANTKSTQVFEFDVQTGDTFFFDAQSATGFSTSATWRLFDPYGNEVFERALTQDQGPVTLDVAGTYRILVEGRYSDTGSDGEFVFEVVALGNALNPTSPTAITVGDVVNGDIAKVHETDRYAFTLTNESLIYFDSLTNDSSLNWSLQKKSGGTLVSNRAFSSSDSSGNASPVLNLRAGDYELSVTSNAKEPYSFQLQDLASATSVVPDTQFSSELNPINKTDVWQFTADAQEAFYLDVVSTSDSSAYVRVIDQFGRVAVQKTSLTDIDVFKLPHAGTYYLLVEGRINETSVTAYEMNVISVTKTQAALNLGETQAGAIAGIGDTTEYKFNLPSLATLYFDSLTDSALVWSLTGPGGSVITNKRFNASDSFNNATPLLKSLPAGDYSLTVDGTGDAVGNFSFRLLDIATDATPITLGTPVSGELTIPNETDIYQFTATNGDQLLVDWLAADDTNNSLYRMFDPLNNEVLEVSALLDGETGQLFGTGIYTLLVEGYRTNTGLDTYEFNVINSPTRTVAITVGDLVSESIATPGERIVFPFNIAADSFLYLDSLTNNSQFNWSLTGPTGEIFSQLRLDQSDSNGRTTPVFEARAGDYTLTVDGVNDATGAVDFQLWDVASGSSFSLPATIGDFVTVGGSLEPLDPGNSTNIYRFDAIAGDNLSFDGVPDADNTASYRVVDPFGRTVFTRSIGSDQNNAELAVSGTYTLLIEGAIGSQLADAYELNITFNGNTAPPAIIGDAYLLGTTILPTDSTPPQTPQSYTFNLTDRTLVHMDILTNDSDLRWTLRGPRGVEVDSRSFTSTDSIDSATSNLDLVVGDYQLNIFSNTGASKPFGFTLHNFADAQSVTPGTPFPGELTNSTETDLYQFNANAGDRFLIDVVSTNAAGNKEFKVIDGYGNVVADSSSSLKDVDNLLIPHDGTYTLLVEGRRNNTGTDTYTLNIVPIVKTTLPLTAGESNTTNLTIGSELEYTFSVASPSLIVFSPQTDTDLVEWTLSSAAGTFIANRAFDDGLLPLDLPSGDYTLTVNGVDDYAGDAKFTLLTADAANVLADGVIANSQLTASRGVELYQFNGIAGQHFALRPDFNLVFDDAAASALTAEDLSTSYNNEDAHAGIDVALRNDVFRDGAAINFIAITDEDRDVLDDNVNFETIFRDLSARDALLNSVVSSPFYVENTSGARAIGVDSDGNAYLADGSGGFTTSTGGIATTNQISIRQDYIDLAWALDGAAWDLSQLRAGGVTAQSFTKAFVDVKVSEILEQTSLKLSASDPNADLTFITPDDGVYDNIVGGQQYDFDIQIGNDGNPRSFDLLFKQGQTVGSIPVYIVAPYGYNAMAVDADGDTLTWSITEGPDGLVVDPATGVLAWPADSVVYGVHPVTLRVEDGRGGFDEQTFELDVNGGEAASISGVKFHDENEDGLYQALVDVIVPGDADPYLAGMPDGSTASGGDVAPDQSPIFVEGLELIPGTVLTFAAAGQVSFAGAPNVNETPDGKLSGYGSHAVGAENGISNITSNWNSLLGVFLTDDQPNSNPAPAALDFINASGVPGGINYTSLAPELQQLFFIGDGVTDDGTIQEITVPEGATRLFLGTMDGTGWFNNAGQLFVTISGPQEPTIPDWTIYLDQNRNGIRDEGERSTITDANGSFTFDNLQPGSYVVAEELQPGWAQTAPGTGTFEITVAPGESATGLNFGNKQVPLVNSDPFITSTPLLSVVAREDYRYQPTITELDGDDLAFDLPLGPAGMAVNPVNGTISWTPRLDQIGPQNVLLRVRDERGGFDLQYFTIDVQKPNTAPVITSTPPAGPAGVGLPFTYNADAVDADDDSLIWSLTAAPEGATIDPGTGVINWTPASDQQGAQSFEVSVDDGRGLSATQAFDINVQVDPPNTDPEFLSTPPVEVYLGNAYLYRVQVNDVNGDPLAIALDAAPSGMAIDADGLVSWTPTPTQVGSSLVRIIVNDGRGGTATQEYSVNVDTQPVNQAPQITSPPKTSAVAGQAYNFQPTATDANNDTLVWELVTGPNGMSIDPAHGTINWQPTMDDLGSEQVVIRVFDPSAAFSELGYTLNVRAVNTPPVIQTVPLTTAAVGATFLHQVQATDVDGDQLSYALTTSPTGMVIDPASGLIQWTPVTGQEGSNAVLVRVSDGNGGFATQSFLIETAAGVSNIPPTITTTPGFFSGVGDLYSYDVDANDPENGTLTYELLQSPSGMTIDANSGLIEWTPAAGDLGTSIVRIVARDPAGAGSIQEYSLTVLAANNAPVISSTPPATVAVEGTYRYDVLATDADGEFLTYELINAPAGMLIDGVGRIFWVPTAAETGSNPVEVKVADQRGGTVTQAFDISVEVDIIDPQVAVLLSSNPVTIGDTVDIRISAVDNVGVESLSLTLDGVPVALDSTGLARVPMNSLGSISAVATATDAAGNIATDTITIFVSDPNDVEGPVLNITSPSDGGIVTGLSDIIGTVTDDTLVEYRLLLAEFGTNDFRQVATGNTNVTNDVLGQLDPTLLANGSYILRLEAFDAGGRSNVTQQLVEVAGGNKLGNFRVSFTDLVVPLSGIDVVLARTYDSLNSSQDSDFGFGWRMDFRDVQLQVSVDEASDFDKAYGFYTPYRIGTRVYITLPGGERQGFTFSPSIRQLPSIFGPGLVLATPRFIPDAGVTNQLTVQSGQLLLNEFGETTVSGGLPWNPASPDYGGGFTLTTREGIAYKIDGNSGKVNRISDPNGNQLNFSDAGVTSTSGLAITFERDINDRIVGVVDPEGNRITYGYGDSGNLETVVDRLGHTTTYSYATSPSGYLESITDPLGRTGTRAQYGPDGRLTATLDVDGNSTSYTYDSANSVAVRTDANGNSVIVEYDQRGNVVVLTDPLGGVIRMAYDSRDNLISRTDELGNTTLLEYNAQGDLISSTDPLGNSTRSTFNAMGMPVVSTDAAGNATRRTYDEFGNLASITDPRGATTSFGMDRFGNVTRVTDAEGVSRTSTYDAAGNVLTQTDSLGNTFSCQYDSLGNLLREVSTVTGANGIETREWQYSYDANGNLLTTTDADGQVSEFIYDAAGNRVASEDANGAVTTVVYSEDNQVSSVVRAEGSQSRFVYDAVGNLVELSTGNNDRTWREYDEVGRLLAILFADDTPEDLSDNPRRTFEYDAAGNEIANTDELGNRTEFQYDPIGRLIASIDAAGGVYSRQYDAVGNIVIQTDPLGRLTHFSYDDVGNLTSVEYADGTTVSYVYDSLNRVASTTDELGNSTSYLYDSEGRLLQVTDAMGGQTRYGYDEAGNLISVTDAAGRMTTYEYDTLNRRTATVSPLGYRSEVEYDAVSNPIRQVDADGRANQNFYDAEGRVIRRELWDGTVVTFTYDDQGQLIQMTDETGTSTMTYDVRGRLLSRMNGDGTVISYAYDAAGNRIQVATPGGTSNYTYDALSRLSTVVSTTGGTTAYTYDLASNLTNTVFTDGTSEIRSYDSRDRLVSLATVDATNAPLQSFSYSLLANGLIESVAESGAINRTVRYEYDGLYRLTLESITGATSQNIGYVYDAVGNRLSRNDSITGQTDYSYDANDRLLSEVIGGTTTSYAYNQSGELLVKSSGSDRSTFTYDAAGKLATATVIEAGVTRASTYTYTADGLRVAAVIDGIETRYLVDSNREYSEILDEYTLADGVQKHFVIGHSITTVVDAAIVHALHGDVMGSVRFVTSNGTVTGTSTTDAFGDILLTTGNASEFPGFAGRSRDVVTGLLDMRARDYDSSTGRFRGSDVYPATVGQPATWHRYTFAGNNPVNFTDPTGYFTLAEQLTSTGLVSDLIKTYSKNLGKLFLTAVRISECVIRPGQQLRTMGARLVELGVPRGEVMYAKGSEMIAAGLTELNTAIKQAYKDIADDLKKGIKDKWDGLAKGAPKPKATNWLDDMEDYFKKQREDFLKKGISEKFKQGEEYVDKLRTYVTDITVMLTADDPCEKAKLVEAYGKGLIDKFF